MRTPEEVAERWVGCKPYPDLSRLPEHAIHCRKHVQPWPCQSQAMADLADLIRARDAEITEQVRAEVDRIALTLSTMTTQGMAEVERIAEVAAALVGLTWEARTLDDGYSGWSGDERGGHAIHKTATRQRRLVGPWEPVETAVLLNPPTEGETDHADT